MFVPETHEDYFTLHNGVKVPPLAFGTFRLPESDSTAELVRQAIETGYRHIDTASGYDNERAVGRGIRASGVPREEIFVTTKLNNPFHSAPEAKEQLRNSLDYLRTDYLDLWLIHWPVPVKNRGNWAEANAETWTYFEEALAEGLVRSIGVSNFLPHHIDSLMMSAKVLPMVNQIKLSPGCTQPEIVSYCRERGVLLESYSPFDNGKIFGVPELAALAEKYRRTEAQVVLRWHIQQGFLALPKASSLDRIRENFDIFDFELSPEEMDSLSGLVQYASRPTDPDTEVDW